MANLDTVYTDIAVAMKILTEVSDNFGYAMEMTEQTERLQSAQSMVGRAAEALARIADALDEVYADSPAPGA